MDDANEQKAIALINEAEKKMKGGFFSNLFGGSGKTEEAIGLYERAANSFKMGKKWQGAGDCFCKAARLSLDNKVKHEAASHFVEAANCFKKVDANEAIQCLLKAIEIYTEMGRFTIAAKHHMAVAEIFETQMADVEKAMQHYEQAADYYKGEEATSSANKCLLKVAHMAAQLEQYEKATDIFEQVGHVAMESSLLRYGAKEYFFKAVVCQMTVDIINGQNALKKYGDTFPVFVDSREYKLLTTLLEAMEEHNTEAFSEAVREYDSLSRIDPWLTTLLLKVKKTVDEEEGPELL